MRVGDKVICVNLDRDVYDDGHEVSTPWGGLELNKIYTISNVYPNSITLVELTNMFAHAKFRFKTIPEMRRDKILKIKERLCSM